MHRFIGNVGWRQNRQTYDGVRLQNTSIEGLELEASYIYNVNRIFGEDNPLPNRSDFDLDGRLLRAAYKGSGALTIEGYFYDLDFDTAAVLSTTTIGLRLAGSRPIPGWNKNEKVLPELVYAAEFARQSDTGDNPASYDFNYFLIEAGVNYKGWLLKVSHERLEGTGRRPGP